MDKEVKEHEPSGSTVKHHAEGHHHDSNTHGGERHGEHHHGGESHGAVEGMEHSSSEHYSHHSMDMSDMAASATLHCLTGCAIGEIAGMILSTALGWSNLASTATAIALAFLSGYLLSSLPLLRAGIPVRKALLLVLAADTLSITTMELVDNGVMWLVPGAMGAGLQDLLFWGSMALSFAVAYSAAYPVNKVLLRRGKGHAITHHASGAEMDNRPLAYGLIAFLLGGAISSLGSLI